MKILNVLILTFIFGGFATALRLIDKSFQPVNTNSNITFYNLSQKEKTKEIAKTFKEIKNLNEVMNMIEAKIADNQLKKTIVKKKKIKNKVKLSKITLKKKKFNTNIIELNISSPIEKKVIRSNFSIKVSSFSKINFTLPSENINLNTQKMLATKLNKKIDTYDKSSIDRISTAQSAPEKSLPIMNIKSNLPSLEKTTIKTKQDDGLVFFSYNDDVQKEAAKVEKKSLPKSLPSIVTTAAIVKAKKKEKKKLEVKDDYSKYLALLNNKPKAKAQVSSNTETSNGMVPTDYVPSNISSQSKIMLSAFGINFKGQQEIVYDYRVEFHDDIYEKANSDKEGYAVLSDKINGDYSTRRVSIVSGSYLTMTTELIYENDSVPFQIPLISREHYLNLMNKRNINDTGSSLLVELDENTDQIDIDSNYNAKLFLDKNYRVVEPEQSDYFYVLFIGLEPGNRVLSYKTKINNRVVDRIIHLRDGEVFFDKNYFDIEKKQMIAFFEENLMGTQKMPLSITENEFSKMISDVQIRQDSLNRFKLLNSLTALGSRKYYVLSHLAENVYVGNWNKKSIIVPSESYMRYVISGFENYNEQNCMIQINLEKKAKSFMYNGDTGSSHLGITAKILDSDGVLYNDLSDQSRRIFLKGDNQGIVNIKINYVDGSVDYLQTFCSSASYLVEQL